MEQLEVLEDDAHFLSQGWNVLAADGLQVSAQDFCLVGLALHEVELAVEGFQERALSWAHLTDEIGELAFVYMEVDALEYAFLSLVYADVLIIY